MSAGLLDALKSGSQLLHLQRTSKLPAKCLSKMSATSSTRDSLYIIREQTLVSWRNGRLRVRGAQQD